MSLRLAAFVGVLASIAVSDAAGQNLASETAPAATPTGSSEASSLPLTL